MRVSKSKHSLNISINLYNEIDLFNITKLVLIITELKAALVSTQLVTCAEVFIGNITCVKQI